jgi:hypothetical protein
VTAQTLDIDGFVAAFEREPPGEGVEALLAAGGWGVEGHDRIGLIALEERPRLLEDAYLPSGEIHSLWLRIVRARSKGAVRRGGWDTMHATGRGHAWSDDAGSFVLIDRGGRMAWVEGIGSQHGRRGVSPLVREYPPRIAVEKIFARREESQR